MFIFLQGFDQHVTLEHCQNGRLGVKAVAGLDAILLDWEDCIFLVGQRNRDAYKLFSLSESQDYSRPCIGSDFMRLDFVFLQRVSGDKARLQRDLNAAFPCVPDLETFRSVLDNKT